jgi:hypothetical protein
MKLEGGADDRNRTGDLRVTSALFQNATDPYPIRLSASPYLLKYIYWHNFGTVEQEIAYGDH